MGSACKTNNWVTEGIFGGIQVTFIFAFLTVFFFVYVSEVEKEEFQKQLNLVVDNIMKDIEDDLPNILKKQDILGAKDAVVIINGVLDTLEEKIAMDAKSSVQEILKQNYGVKIKALKALSAVILLMVVIVIAVLLLGFCVPLSDQIKESMIVVVFVGITELVFLEVVASHYISANPNKIKRALGQSIQKWVEKHK